MKTKKKLSFALVFLTICIICSITSTTVSANTKFNTLDDIRYMDMEEYDAYLDTLSEEEKQALLESLTETLPDYCYVDENYYEKHTENMTAGNFNNMPEKIQREQQLESLIEEELSDMSQINSSNAAAYKISLPGSFTIYQQTTPVYCGAACVQSALTYINGSSPSQSEIYLRVLNDFTRVAPYMNIKQTETEYYFKHDPTDVFIISSFHNDIVYDQIPAFARIVVTESGDWRYTTSGHCLLVNAVYSDYSQFQFADPAATSTTTWPAFYLEPKERVINVCKDIVW